MLKRRLLVLTALISGCVIVQAPGPAGSPNGQLSVGVSLPPIAPAASGPATPPTPVAAPTGPPAAPSAAPLIPWSRLPDLPIQTDLGRAAVYARTVGDVYVATGATDVWHLAGQTWEKQTVPGTIGVSSLSPIGGALYATTDDGTVFRLAGTTWTQVDKLLSSADSTSVLELYKRLIGSDYQTPTSIKLGSFVVGSANNYLFLGGPNGLAWTKQKDAGSWTQPGNLNANLTLLTVYLGGSAPQEAFFAGSDGALIRNQGSAFLPVASPTKSRINALTNAGFNGIYAAADGGVVMNFGSDAWQIIVNEPKLGNVLGISAISARETVFVTAKGQLYAGPYTLLR